MNIMNLGTTTSSKLLVGMDATTVNIASGKGYSF
jgi:hypothetical protein